MYKHPGVTYYKPTCLEYSSIHYVEVMAIQMESFLKYIYNQQYDISHELSPKQLKLLTSISVNPTTQYFMTSFILSLRTSLYDTCKEHNIQGFKTYISFCRKVPIASKQVVYIHRRVLLILICSARYSYAK